MIPDRYARYYLENAPSLGVLICLNLFAVLVGIRFYVDTMPAISTVLWPFYLDSPVALFFMTASLLMLVPNLGRPIETMPNNRMTAIVHTLAFVWLVKFGLWTVVALHLGFDLYFPSVTDYWFIVITHLAFVVQAFLIPHYGVTSREALILAGGLLLVNDILDYGFGLHPPLRYEPGLSLTVVSVGLTVLAVWLAHRSFDRLETA